MKRWKPGTKPEWDTEYRCPFCEPHLSCDVCEGRGTVIGASIQAVLDGRKIVEEAFENVGPLHTPGGD